MDRRERNEPGPVIFEEGGFSARKLQRSRPPETVFVDGTRGWLVVVVAFLANVVAFGITYSFGVMFEGVSTEFGAGRGATAAVFSLSMALHFLLGGVTGPATDRHGPRALLLMAAAVMGAGLLVTSTAPALWIAGIAYGVGTGVGTACTYVPMISAVAGWFDRWRSVALGITVAGVGVGTLAVAPLAARLVGQFGIRTTCAIFGLISMLALAACALAAFRPPPPGRPAAAAPTYAYPAPNFARLYASAAGFAAAAFIPLVFLAPFAEHHGIQTLQAASLVGIVGVASTAGRLTLGALAAHCSALALYRTCFLGLGLSLVVWFLGNGRYDYLVGFALLLGTAQGGGAALLPAVTVQLYGARGMGRKLGTLHTGGGFGCLVGPPLAGVVIDLTDGYTAAIALSAAVVFGSWALLRPDRPHVGRPSVAPAGGPETAAVRPNGAARAMEIPARLPRNQEDTMSTALHEPRTHALHRRGFGRTAWTLACTTLRKVVAALVAERNTLRAIRELESFDDRRLRDLGLTRLSIERAVRFGRRPDSEVPRAAGGRDRVAAA